MQKLVTTTTNKNIFSNENSPPVYTLPHSFHFKYNYSLSRKYNPDLNNSRVWNCTGRYVMAAHPSPRLKDVLLLLQINID